MRTRATPASKVSGGVADSAASREGLRQLESSAAPSMRTAQAYRSRSREAVGRDAGVARELLRISKRGSRQGRCLRWNPLWRIGMLFAMWFFTPLNGQRGTKLGDRRQLATLTYHSPCRLPDLCGSISCRADGNGNTDGLPALRRVLLLQIRSLRARERARLGAPRYRGRPMGSTRRRPRVHAHGGRPLHRTPGHDAARSAAAFLLRNLRTSPAGVPRSCARARCLPDRIEGQGCARRGARRSPLGNSATHGNVTGTKNAGRNPEVSRCRVKRSAAWNRQIGQRSSVMEKTLLPVIQSFATSHPFQWSKRSRLSLDGSLLCLKIHRNRC